MDMTRIGYSMKACQELKMQIFGTASGKRRDS